MPGPASSPPRVRREIFARRLDRARRALCLALTATGCGTYPSVHDARRRVGTGRPWDRRGEGDGKLDERAARGSWLAVAAAAEARARARCISPQGPSGSNRFNAQWQRSLSTAGPALRQSTIALARARERARTTYVLHGYASTHWARPTHPLSSLLETDGAWRKDEGRRERELESASDGERKRERENRPYVRTYWRIHFIGRKNPLGNYRQIYADTRRTTDRGGISRSNVGTRTILIGQRGKSGEGREKIKRGSMINRGGAARRGRASDRSRYCKTMFVRCGETPLSMVASLPHRSNLDRGP